jgi:hypothetical protein
MTERTLCDQLGGQRAADTCAEALAYDGHLASITAVAGDNPVPRGPGVKQKAGLGRRAGRIAEAAVVDDEYIDVERGRQTREEARSERERAVAGLSRCWSN